MKHTQVVAKAVLRRVTDGKILLLRRSETDRRRPNQWDFPGGMVEDDEDFVLAAARETFEEAGITIEPKDLHLAYATSILADSDFGSVCWLLFIGQVADVPVTLSFEHSEHSWVTLDEAIDLIEYDRQKGMLQYIKDGTLFE